MEFMMFFGIPFVFGLLQYFVTRSGLPMWKKYLPLLVAGSVAAVSLGAIFDRVPLPQTYFFARLDAPGGFISFPDFFYTAVFALSAIVGIAFGALFGVSKS